MIIDIFYFFNFCSLFFFFKSWYMLAIPTHDTLVGLDPYQFRQRPAWLWYRKLKTLAKAIIHVTA